MSVLDMLYAIFIGPLQLVFEIIFAISNRMTGHPGIAIVVLSLIMNFLVLPLYRRADAMQEKARDVDEKLRDGVNHIKKSFSGDERMLILQTYYRQNHYKPTDALNGSVSLLLEVPFFIAAYQFLSHLAILQGVSLGPISDLSAPDGLLVLGGISINLLPILMTLVNIISSALYLKGFPLKTKIQLYAMALFFLVFLYNSPSGLVFYWTLNNLFSLGKNIFYKLKEPMKILSVIFSITGLTIVFYGLFGASSFTLKSKAVSLLVGAVFQFPTLLQIKRIRVILNKYSGIVSQYDKKVFLLGCIFLSVLVGVLIPSTVIAASPMEFMNIGTFYNPLWYLVNSYCMSAGAFIVWMGVFYWLASEGGKAVFDILVWLMSGIAIVDYMFFGTNLGTLSANLSYENGMQWGFRDEISNLIVVILVISVMCFFIKKARNKVSILLFTVILAVVCMSGRNLITIHDSSTEFKQIADRDRLGVPYFNLSRTGNNIIVLMLDRAMNQYVPYLFNEKPELKEKFEGFTFYPNTISYGAYTNFTTPSLFGGYEYTPVEINKRDKESLKDKQNEALKVLPAIFSENDFEVTVCDPPYAGYTWSPDLSIFDDIEGVKTYITQGKFEDEETQRYKIEHRKRNFFCFGLMKVVPAAFQEIIYDGGHYNQTGSEKFYTGQVMENENVSHGINSAFMEQYNVLLKMSEMTNIVDDNKDTFVTITNCTTHEPMLLKKPEYEPAMDVDNTAYEEESNKYYNIDGREMKMDTFRQIIHYHTTMATFIQLGRWFDYMREQGVYDNTRIILVSDHGRGLGHFEELMLNENEIETQWEEETSVEWFCPLFMVKDFNSSEYVVSEEFMTNADVPTLALEGVVEHAINPYTGKEIENSAKMGGAQYITTSSEFDVLTNNGNVFHESQWLEFKGTNVWEKDNWKLLKGQRLLPVEE